MPENIKGIISISSRRPGETEYCHLCDDVLKSELVCTGESKLGKIWTLTLKNCTKEDFQGVVHIEVCFPSKNPAFFMPAYLYNRNRGNAEPYRSADGHFQHFPRLMPEPCIQGASPYWMVRGDRLSHPVSMAYDEGMVYGISGNPCSKEPCGFNGFSCRLGKTESSVGFTIGYENAPWLYVYAGEPDYKESDLAGRIGIAAGESKTVTFETFAYPAEDKRAVYPLIRYVYQKYHQAPRKGAAVSEAVRDIAQAIYQDAYIDSVKNYGTQVYLNHGEITMNPWASISWTGGVEIASPLLLAAARLHDEKMREQAAGVIQNIVDHSMNPDSGLPFDAFEDGNWTTKGWWEFGLKESGHSSYLVGQALYYIVHAIKTEREFFAAEHPDWIEFVKNVLDRIELTKNTEGEVPHIWSAENGSGLDYDSFSGCWCVAAAAYWDKVCDTDRYLKSAEKSLQHYYTAYVQNVECYGTPHDTYKAVDSEGNLAFIKAARLLHEETGKDKYLQMLEDGLEYEFTFKFCWNPPVEAEPLKRIGWSACGGTVTSTCNPHIHPMSSNVVDEIDYCAQQTGDSYYAQRRQDTLDWSCQTYSRFDGEYDFGKKGWMSERFCYSQALLIEKYENGDVCSTWKCFLPWGASNLLDGLCGSCWTES